MPEDQEQKGDVKEHQKKPKQRLLSPDCGHEEGIGQGQEPLWPFFRKDLKGGGILGFAKYPHQPGDRSQQKDRKAAYTMGTR